MEWTKFIIELPIIGKMAALLIMGERGHWQVSSIIRDVEALSIIRNMAALSIAGNSLVHMDMMFLYKYYRVAPQEK